MLCKFNQFPCSLEANNEARVGRGHGDVGGGHTEEDRRPEKAPETAEDGVTSWRTLEDSSFDSPAS